MADDYSALYGPAGELGGQAIGDLLAQGKYAQVAQMLEQLKGQYAALPGASTVGPSALGGVTEDPNISAAERQALSQLMGIATGGGMSAGDKAKLEQAKLSGLAVERGIKGAGEDALRRRGVYSSGAELASDLSAQQGGINTAYQGDMATAASASDRALQALQAGGALASNLGSRDLSQKDLAASANDRIGQFNSGIAEQNALDKLKGISGVDAQQAALLLAQARGGAAKGGGYGRQIGDLLGALGKGGGGKNPSDAWSTPDAPGTQNTLDYNANLQPDVSDLASAGGGSGAGDYNMDDLMGLFS